ASRTSNIKELAGSLKQSEDGDWTIDLDGQTAVLGRFVGRTFAVRELETLSRLAATRGQRRQRVWGGFVLGIVVGAAGSYSVWRRSRRTPEVVALAGIARTFQNIRLFPSMTLLENVLTARDRHFRAGTLQMALRTPNVRREEAAATARAKELLAFVGLDRQ